jgi:predicted nucleotidyltransferase
LTAQITKPQLKYGLKKEVLTSIVTAISKIEKIEKAMLYGSRAKGNYRPGSDIDIALFGNDLTLHNTIYPLMDLLDSLDLPYIFDLSIFTHIDNQNLIDHIIRAGKLIYSK